MHDGYTTLGGKTIQFPSTDEDLLASFRTGRREDVIRKVLGPRYWKPVYAVIRTGWRKSNEEAKDLTQAFFLWLVEKDALMGFAELGSFRKYLKVLLQRFVGHQEEALRSLKRGGDRALLSLDAVPPELQPADPGAADPDVLFDRSWWSALVYGAVERVRRRHEAPDDPAFRVYEAYELSPEPGGVTYADVALRLGLDEKAVKRHLFAVRAEVREDVRREMARLTADDRELREEWDALFGA